MPGGGAPAGPSGPQGLGEFTAEFSAALDVERLVDRLVRHAHLQVVGKVPAELGGYLLGAPAPFQRLLYQPLLPWPNRQSRNSLYVRGAC